MPKANDRRPLRTCKEAEGRTAIKEVTWRKWIAEGRVSCVRLGRTVRIPDEEIERLIEQNTVPAREAGRG